MPFIKWSIPGQSEQKFDLTQDEVTIGRLSESDISLSNPYISRQHAKISRVAEGQYRIVDQNSTHGTFVNGMRVTERLLNSGDKITLGREQVELQVISEGEEGPGKDLDDTSFDSMIQMTSVIPLPDSESSHLQKISHLLDFQYNWEKTFSAEATFRQILDAALKLSGAERGYIMLKEDPSFKYVVGLNGKGQRLSESEFRTSHSVVRKVTTGGQPVIMTENIDQAFANQQSIVAMDLRAVACMPLKWITASSEESEVRGILYLDSTKTMHALSGLDQKILNKLAVEASNVFEKLQLIQAFEEKKAIEKELALANETQTALLPLELPEVDGFSVAAFSQPTRHVGGDFYDFLMREDCALSGVLADVSGKGISAALLSSLVQGALQMECQSGSPLHESLALVNQYLCKKSKSNRFVTLFLFAFKESGKGVYLSAGHNPAYVFRAADKSIEEWPAQDLVLGAFSFATYSSIDVQLKPGDTLVAYSDGVTEAMNPDDEMFGEDRLRDLIREHAPSGSEILKRQILEAIQQFTEGMPQTDDMTLLIAQKQ